MQDLLPQTFPPEKSSFDEMLHVLQLKNPQDRLEYIKTCVNRYPYESKTHFAEFNLTDGVEIIAVICYMLEKAYNKNRRFPSLRVSSGMDSAHFGLNPDNHAAQILSIISWVAKKDLTHAIDEFLYFSHFDPTRHQNHLLSFAKLAAEEDVPKIINNLQKIKLDLSLEPTKQCIKNILFLAIEKSVELVKIPSWTVLRKTVQLLKKFYSRNEIANKIQFVATNPTSLEDKCLLKGFFAVLETSGRLPTSYMPAALKHFQLNPTFIIKCIRGDYSNTHLDNCLDALIQIFPNPVDLIHNHNAQQLVEKLMNSSFRAFSKNTFMAYKNTDPKDRLRLIQAWIAYSNQFKWCSPSSEEHPFFCECLWNAFQPVDMSISELKNIFSDPRITDNTAHLVNLQYPENGWKRTLGASVLLQGINLDQNLEIFLRPILQMCQNTSSYNQTAILLFTQLAKQGKLPTLEEICTIICFLSQQPVCSALKNKLESLRNGMAPPGISKYYTLLPKIVEMFTKELQEAISRYLETFQDNNNELEKLNLNVFRANKARFSCLEKVTRAELSSDLYRILQNSLVKIGLLRHLKQQEKILVQEAGGDPIELTFYLSKNKFTYLGRAAVGLCTANDLWSWNNPDFYQIIIIENDTQQIEGNIQLYRLNEQDILARGINPSENLLERANPAELAKAMLSVIQEFTAENKLTPYIPAGQSIDWHELTNLPHFADHLYPFMKPPSLPCNIKIAEDLSGVDIFVEKICQLRPIET